MALHLRLSRAEHKLSLPHFHGIHFSLGDPKNYHCAHYTQLSDDDRAVVDFLEGEQAPITAGQIADRLQKPETLVQQCLDRLVDEDWARLSGDAGQAGYYLGQHTRECLAPPAQIKQEFDQLKSHVYMRVVHYVRYRILAIAITYLTQILLARHMGVESYGFYSLVVGVGTLLSHFLPLGFGTTLVRYLPSYEKEGDWNLFHGLINRSYQMTFLSSLAVVLIGYPIIIFWDMGTGHKFTFMLGLLLGPLTAFTDVISCQLEGEKRFESSFFLDIFLSPLLLLAAVALLAFYMHLLDHKTAMMATAGVQTVMLLIMLSAFLRTLPPQVKTIPPKYKTKKWFKTALPVLIMTGFMVLIYRADLFIVGAYLGREAAGIYAAVLTITGILALFLKAVDSSTNPEIGPMFKAGEMGDLQKLSTLIAKISCWPTLVVSVAFMLLGNHLLDLFGHGFRPGYWPMVILCASWVVKGASGAPGFLLLMTGKQMKLVKVYVFMVVLDLALLAVLTPIWGLVGAATASFLALLVSRVALVVVTQKEVGINTSIASAWTAAKPGAGGEGEAGG